MNKTLNKFALFTMAAAVLSQPSFSSAARKTFDDNIKKREPLPPKGSPFTYPDGVLIYALNQKNADRKYKNLITKRS